VAGPAAAWIILIRLSITVIISSVTDLLIGVEVGDTSEPPRLTALGSLSAEAGLPTVTVCATIWITLIDLTVAVVILTIAGLIGRCLSELFTAQLPLFTKAAAFGTDPR